MIDTKLAATRRLQCSTVQLPVDRMFVPRVYTCTYQCYLAPNSIPSRRVRVGSARARGDGRPRSVAEVMCQFAGISPVAVTGTAHLSPSHFNAAATLLLPSASVVHNASPPGCHLAFREGFPCLFARPCCSSHQLPLHSPNVVQGARPRHALVPGNTFQPRTQPTGYSHPRVQYSLQPPSLTLPLCTSPTRPTPARGLHDILFSHVVR